MDEKGNKLDVSEDSPSSPRHTTTDYYSPQSKTKLLSPSKASCLSPAMSYLNRVKPKAKYSNLIKLCGIPSEKPSTYEKQPETSAYEGVIRMSNVRNGVDGKEEDDLKKSIQKSTNGFESPSNFMRRIDKQKKDFSILGNLVKITNEDVKENEQNFTLIKNSKKANNSELPPMEGWIYKITESTKIKKYWLVINNMEIYYYKSETKEEPIEMHNLSGCYVAEAPAVTIKDYKLFCFTIAFQSKIRSYYTADKEQAVSWVNRIRKAIGYESFYEHYDIIDDLGRGKFGVVKLGVHKKTKLRVAIKTIKKDSLKTKQDQELVMYELDIMKVCKHPNIVNLLDHFENSEYIFIVMEYIQGGNLTNYVQKYYGGKTNKILPEKRVAELMKQLALGLEYLHNFGIIHRDLKPDNLMITERSVNGEIKIMDFGLSKIMHHDEKVLDGFGTLCFVAPEVLLRKPYNKQVDVWSLGVTLYNLLCGDYPFDDSSDKEDVIARKIVYNEVEFHNKLWDKISKEAKLVILDCLIKDPDKRITLQKLLKHSWFEKILGINK